MSWEIIEYGQVRNAKMKKDVTPDFDICLDGFLCLIFSMAGRRMGFNDDYKGRCRGTLFFDVAEICKRHNPRVLN